MSNSVAVLCQIHDFSIWKNDIENRLVTMFEKCPFDLYITLTDYVDRSIHVENILSVFPNAYVYVVPNLGEDIRGFVYSIEKIREMNKVYSMILKLHTKHEDDWRGNLLRGLISENVYTNQSMMTGGFDIIANEMYYRKYDNPHAAEFNAIYLDELRGMCNCAYRTNDHFSGSMLWMSWRFFKRYFLDSKLTSEYFNQPYAIGYTKQHSFELLFGCCAYDYNAKVLLV